MNDTVARNTDRIVVGVDGSDISHQALRWAVGEAQLRHLPLEVVHVWQMIYPVEPMTGVGAIQFSPQQLATEAQALLGATVAETVPTSGHRTAHGPTREPAGRTLVEHSKGADLLVIGRHGHHGLLAKLLGSIAEHVVHHADGPIVAIPA
ncbi:MAG: universal stress protein [Ilumatobacteraceae bacterium]